MTDQLHGKADRFGHAELVSASINQHEQTPKQVQGDATSKLRG